MTTEVPAASKTDREERYVREAFRIAAGLSKEEGHCLPPVPRNLQKLFLRSEEYESLERDQWDNWEFAYSDNFKRGQLWLPECDMWLQEQMQLLRGQGVHLEPRWPRGHEFAVCLTHDVDYIGETMTFQQRGREFLRSVRAHDLQPQTKVFGSVKGLAKLFLRKSSSVPATSNTLEISYKIEKEFGVKASYFFTVPPRSHISHYDCLYDLNDKCWFLGKSRRVKDLMRHLCQEGHDVGLHGSYFSAVVNGLLAEQKGDLEKALGAEAATTRQHWLHLRVPQTWSLQADAGFKSDTTLGFNRNIGYRAGTGLPFFPFNCKSQTALPLVELPLVIQDGALIGENALEYTPHHAFEVVKRMLGQARQTEGCVTFLFHPDIFLKPGLAPLYRSIIGYALSQNAWVADVNAIQSWWRERAGRLS